MISMYVVRRHSRKLFFPAGLLALSWLLCLGCALLAARPELRRLRQRVIQLSAVSPEQIEATKQKPLSAFSTQLYTAPLKLPAPLHTVCFTGNAWQDDLSTRTAAFVARQLQAEPTQDRGLRIEFEAGSHYQTLVSMLDLMRSTDQKRYWLDLKRLPISLNAFTVYSPPSNTLAPDGCFLCDDVIPYTPPPPPTPSWHQELLAELSRPCRLSTWPPLFGPAWRYSTLLLLLLPPAAAWQLRRLRATNFRR